MLASKRLWALALGILCLLGPIPAWAAPPALLPLQGYLSDEADVALDGTYRLRFALFVAATDGAALYTVEQAVTVTAGNFTVYLGDQAPLDLQMLHDNSSLWLEITVVQDCDADTTCNTGTLVNRALAPRLQLATTAFAASASYCEDAETVGGMAPSAFSGEGHEHAWSELTGVPAGFADGIDNNTTYSGTTFALSNQTCDPGQRVTGIAANGTLICTAVPSQYSAKATSTTAVTVTTPVRAFCALTSVEHAPSGLGQYRWCTVVRNPNGTWSLSARSSSDTTTTCKIYCF